MTTKPSEQGKVLWRPNPGQQTFALTRTENEILYGGARGCGKGLAKVSGKVLTPFGWKIAGDIEVGDQVCNPDGSTSRIIQVFERGPQQTYRFNFTSGASVVVDGDHLWKGKFVGHKIKRELEYRIYSTKELVREYQEGLHPRFMIPLTKPVSFQRPRNNRWGDQRPVDPYLLGLLLGDGCLRGGSIGMASEDEEIIEYCGQFARLAHDRNSCSFRLVDCPGLKKSLKKIGVYGKLASTKSVPENYLWAYEDERRGVLQGLMDTDGTVGAGSNVSFTSVSIKLAKDVQFLSRSLGYKATLSGPHRSMCNGEEKQVHYDVYINGPDLKNVFRLIRKRERVLDRQKQHWQLALKSIDKLGEEETVCFQVDNPNGLFITDDFIVTHNTDASIVWLLRWIHIPSYRFLIIRRNARDLSDWVDRAKRMYEGTGAVFTESKVTFPSGATGVFGHLFDDDSYEKYQGHEYQKMVIEELTHIPSEELYLKLRASNRSTVDGLKPQTFSTTNPGGEGHRWVKERFVDIGKSNERYVDKFGLTRIFIPARVEDNPVLTEKDPGYIAFLDSLPGDLKKAWRDGSWDLVEVKGAYYANGVKELRDKKQITKVPYDKSALVHTWWDIGVGDSTAIIFAQQIGREWHFIDFYETEGEGLQHYIDVLQKRGYLYGNHYAPHDIEQRELSTGITRKQTAARLGINFTTVPKLSIDDGIQAVRTRLNTVWIDEEKCATLIEALYNYKKVWDDLRQTWKPRPLHDWTCFTGDTMILTQHGMCPIMSLGDDDQILTPNGWRGKTHLGITRRDASLVEVLFNDGTTVRCTPDHLFQTRGLEWKSARDLERGTLILSSLTISRSISMGASIVYGLMKAILREVAGRYIEPLGKMRLAPYLRSVIYTILTATRSTTPSLTLNVSTGESTCRRQDVNRKMMDERFGSTPPQETRQQSGTVAPQGACGIDDTRNVLRRGLSGKGRNESVRSARRSFKQLSDVMGILISSVIQTVRPLTIESVKEIEETEDVWDFHVPDELRFSLYNGAVVHNSHAADAMRYWAVTDYKERTGVTQSNKRLRDKIRANPHSTVIT